MIRAIRACGAEKGSDLFSGYFLLCLRTACRITRVALIRPTGFGVIDEPVGRRVGLRALH